MRSDQDPVFPNLVAFFDNRIFSPELPSVVIVDIHGQVFKRTFMIFFCQLLLIVLIIRLVFLPSGRLSLPVRRNVSVIQMQVHFPGVGFAGMLFFVVRPDLCYGYIQKLLVYDLLCTGGCSLLGMLSIDRMGAGIIRINSLVSIRNVTGGCVFYDKIPVLV